jgi:hypothetical protein
MNSYTYTDSQPRYYVDLGIEARPGKVYEFAEAPDDRFELVGTESAKRPDRTPGVAESTPQAPFDASIIPDDPKGA